jgi:aminocarboxymuconate-semialdehyde decarboxylase
MQVVDCQVHLHTRTYFEAHVERVEPPSAERSDGGYIFSTPDGTRCAIPSARYEIEEQLECCAANGVDVVVSSMGRFNVHHLPASRALELAMQLNEEQAELERSHPGRYYGLATLPMQDAQAAIETLDHAVRALGLRGVCICSNVNGESIATPARDPIFRRIHELGVPIFLHPTMSPLEPLMRYSHENSVGCVVDSSMAVLDLIFSGVLDRHPSLRIVHPHLGGVLPYVASRIDDDHNGASTAARLERRPSDYLRRFHTDTAGLGLGLGALRMAADVYGPEQLLYASDYPNRLPAAGLDLVHRDFRGEARDQVLHGNAASLLGLGVAGAA